MQSMGIRPEGGEMNLKVYRYSIQIIPESAVDNAFIEEVLGLKENGDSVKLTRVNVTGFGTLGYIEARKEREE